MYSAGLHLKIHFSYMILWVSTWGWPAYAAGTCSRVMKNEHEDSFVFILSRLQQWIYMHAQRDDYSRVNDI